MVPPIAPVNTTANSTPETYDRRVNTLGSISGVAPDRLR